MPEEDIKELKKYVGGSKRRVHGLISIPTYITYRILDILCLIIEDGVPALILSFGEDIKKLGNANAFPKRITF